MAGSKVVQCVGPSYHLQDKKAAVQSTVNCYPSRLNDTDWILVNSPGEVQVATMTGGVRNQIVVKSRMFVVVGQYLYEKNADDTFTNRAMLLSSSGFVGMAYNESQLAIVDGLHLYIYTLATNTIQQVTSPGWLGSDDVKELDGYFIFVDPATEIFYISAIDDGTSLDALDFSSADASPDNIITHRVSHRQLWLFGDITTEIWVDSGNALFPFARYQSYTLDVGVVGKRAAINAADTLFWIGKTERGSGIVYMAAANQPQRVSTTAVEESLLRSADLTQATMWTYQIEGHEFIGINAPGLDKTWVFDAAVQQWHERGEWNDGWQPLRSKLHVAYGTQHYAGDDQGVITRLDDSVNTLAGRVLARERTWPHFMKDSLEPTVYRSLELAMKSGAGGSVTLEISNDGGYTWGAPLVRSLGAVGRFMQRIRWMPLGTAINRVFRIRVTDDVPFTIHQAAVDAS